MSRQRFLIAALSALILTGGLLARPAPAAARKSVSVRRIKGAGGKRIQAWLEREIGKRYDIVPFKALRSVARAIGIKYRMLRTKNLRRAARKARVDALVSGSVRRAHGKYWLALQVRDCETGKVVKHGTIPYPNFRLTKWGKRAALILIAAGLERVRGVPRPYRRRVAPERDPDRVERPRPRPTEKPRAKGPQGPRRFGIQVAVGAAVWGRWLNLRGLDGSSGSTLQYKTDVPAAPLTVSLETYPGAFATRHRAWANLGLSFTYQRAVGAVTYPAATPTLAVTTTVQRVTGALLYRHHFSDAKRAVVLRVQLGVEALEYSFAQDLGRVAGVSYLAIKPGLELRIPVESTPLALAFGVAGLGVAQVGQAGNAQHYGAGPAGGVEAWFEFDVRLFWKIHLLAGLRTAWWFLSFRQAAGGYVFAADGAVDGYLAGYALAAVRY